MFEGGDFRYLSEIMDALPQNDQLIQAMRLTGFNIRGDRQKDDFYATPEHVTRALLDVESFDGDVLEPCCGQGHISKVLTAAGLNVASKDLIDRGYGQAECDFLLEAQPFDNVITNPPYGRLALQMAQKANEIARKKVALLLKLQFLEGVQRKRFFEQCPPRTVYVFSARQSLWKNGEYHKGGMMALAWFVWEKGFVGETKVRWI